MTITAIKQQERIKGRYSIYVDDKYAFSLSADTLLDEKLHNGFELDDAQLKVYKKLSADDKAYNLTLAYVARRLRSRYELTDYFRRKGYDEVLAGDIMQKLERYDFVNDERFARAWVNDRRLLRSTSKRRLMQELRAKRITDDIIQIVLADDETDDRTTLIELVTKKRRQTKYQDNVKLMQYLARQGFNYEDIKHALEATDE